MTTVILGHLNKYELEIKDIYLTPEYLVELINLVEKGDISSKQSKEVFYKILEDKKSPSEIVKSLGMKQIGDEDTLRPMIVKIIEEHIDLIEEYRKGRNVFDFFVGQVMKQTRGQANPSLTAKIIKEEIDKR
jgi:aspartyl-tRNA(Asn)/glutamyl-tRNA(Gln) amidotransferase subunit B